MAYNDNPSYLKLSGGTMTGLLTLVGDPSGPNDAANKSYVDALSAGLNFKTACVCATTTNLTATYLNGALGVGATLINAGALVAFTVDGITPTINQRVLVKNQTSEFQNGIYTITTLGTGAVAWILTRATDYDQAAEINPGDIVPVSTGTTQANTSWLQTGFITTMGTDLITFQQYQSTPIATTQYDVLVGGAANTIVGVGPGSSGQVLQSGGASANPAYSTATFPSTATGTGKILRADGTNWVATTATYPDTSGTVGDFLVSDGTNFLSTSVGGLTQKNIVLTSAQIKALHGTPINLVAAQGSGKVIVLVSSIAKFFYGGSNVFVAGAAQTIAIAYGTTPLIQNALISNATIVGTASVYQAPLLSAISSNPIANLENVALNAYVTVATEISGNAANDNTVTISILYYVINI